MDSLQTEAMGIESFEQLVKTRQSCRSFSTRQIEREKIEKIVELTLLSPSACNSQPYSLAVISGEKAKAAAPITQMLGTNKFTSNCPVFIAIIEEKANLMERLGERFTGQDFTNNDIGIAAATMVLAAKACGVDSCILGSFREDKLKEFLGLNKKRHIALVVALGYATEGYPTREKKRKTPPPVTYTE